MTIELTTPLTAAVIQGNNFLTLSLEATARNAHRAIATVILEIVKQDTTTPVFGRHVYYGTYEETNTVLFESIALSQGYDNTVTFRIEGGNSHSVASAKLLFTLRYPATIKENADIIIIQ